MSMRTREDYLRSAFEVREYAPGHWETHWINGGCMGESKLQVQQAADAAARRFLRGRASGLSPAELRMEIRASVDQWLEKRAGVSA